MEITYTTKKKISVEAYVDLICSTTLKDRRPINDYERIEQMLKNANLIVTAWDGNELVGIARSVTDFSFCCYVSDLAVRGSYQKKGIGKKLLQVTKDNIHNNAKLILLAAPQATEYYPHIGFERHNAAFVSSDVFVI
ncbi:Acetyltransferase (GNAT) domain-containing protein [Succinivibrio dextrinosolvens]|uniref:GNAT family N-acetyltransferase n=1 Tax=Succinivibrio dextrinosolvens TaxID=83771 RepID=UPI0008E5C5E0|nr:GNAT family N-acetyltransferase [Succinivibrio dextrinosolvens]SFS90979.1 Acetyltransferase (GNAT) domain-containing protein [Succinivibrio dextrinosolvens]